MQRAAEAAGVSCRTGARVARIEIEGDRATGVTLDHGEALSADLVVSALSPGPTFRGHVGARHLDAGFQRRSTRIRARGAAAKLHLALTALPDFAADPTHRLVVAPSVDAVETAWNPVKYNEVPENPVLEAMLPSVLDRTLAPEGHHVLSAIVQFAPHAPADREAARAAMLENTLHTLESHAPGLRALIGHAEMLRPWDIEAKTGLAGGSWHGADLAVEQMLFLRPIPQLAQYATPIPGLWLAGAGQHPGGGVTGSAGWTAAERILAEAA
jgi:phytoene dehydrogenase-like protein